MMLNLLYNSILIIISQVILSLCAIFVYNAMDMLQFNEIDKKILDVIFTILFIQTYYLIGLLLKVKSYKDAWLPMILYLFFAILVSIYSKMLYGLFMVICFPIQPALILFVQISLISMVLATFIAILFPMIFILIGGLYKIGHKKIWITNLILTTCIIICYSIYLFYILKT